MRIRLAKLRPLGPVHLVRRASGWGATTPGGVLVVLTPSHGATRLAIRRLGGLVARGRGPSPGRAEARGTDFQRRVWAAIRRIPRGKILTYGELARSIGCGSPRAVGQAAAANPLAGLIPCHRVVRKGDPGGFAWGRATKLRWLRHERAGERVG